MFKRLLLSSVFTLPYVLPLVPAHAQNTTCATRPTGDSTNACASTAFVHGGFFPITGTVGGDLSGTLPNPTVTSGAHITNSSIPNAGLVNPGTTVNGVSCILGGTCTISAGIGAGTRGQNANYNATGSTVGPVDNCLNIEAFGGNPNGTTDNLAAWTAATGAAAASGLCIYFPQGRYYFSTAISYTMPNSAFSTKVVGDGPDGTILYFPNSTNGLTINFAQLGNSAHVRDLAFTTTSVNAHNALVFNWTAGSALSAQQAVSDITNVTARGDIGYQSTEYWAIGILTHGVSNIQEDGVNIVGDSAVAFSTNGICQQSEGAISSSQLATQINIAKSNFQYCNNGFIYGPYLQGVTIHQSNFTGDGSASIWAPAGEAGPLDELIVTASQFNQSGIAILENTTIPGTELVANWVLVQQTGTGFDLTGPSSNSFSISDNFFAGQSLTATQGVIINGTGVGTIANNQFLGLATGVWTQSSSSGVLIGTNAYSGNTANTLVAGTGNAAAVTCGPAVTTSSFQVSAGILVHC